MGNLISSNEPMLKIPCPKFSSHKPLTWVSNKKRIDCAKCGSPNKYCRWHCVECASYYCIDCKPPWIYQTKCPESHLLVFQDMDSKRCMKCKNIISKFGWRDSHCNFNICIDCLTNLELRKIQVSNPKVNNNNNNIPAGEEITNPYANYLKKVENNPFNGLIPLIEENNSRIVQRISVEETMVKKLAEESDRLLLESDSYLFASCILSVLDGLLIKVIWCIIVLIFALISSPIALIRNNGFDFLNTSLFSFLNISRGFLLLSFFMLPPLLVSITQILALYEIFDEVDYNNDITQMQFFFLRYMIVWIFNCMVSFEISQGIKVLAVLFKKISVVKFMDEECLCPIFLVCFWPTVVPQFIQIGVALFISFASTAIILNTITILDLIQNFAGLYILLELDNLVMQFLKIINFKNIFLYVSSFSVMESTLKKKFNRLELFSYMNQILDGEDIKVGLEDQKYLQMWERKLNIIKIILIFFVLSVIQMIFFTL